MRSDMKFRDDWRNGKIPKGFEKFGPAPEESLGRNLNTIDDARRWLTHPFSWISSEVWIIYWDGLVPLITRRHGERLIKEPHDTGLLRVIINQQAERRGKLSRGERIDEREKEYSE